MRAKQKAFGRSEIGLLSMLAILLLATLLPAGVHGQPPVTVNLYNGLTGDPVSVDYRWLIEHDLMYHSNGLPDPNTLAVGFHRSYMPVLAKGCVSGDATWQTAAACSEVAFSDPSGAVDHYFISVLPRSGYAIGGASFKDGDGSVDVYVNPLPLPTAQISIFVFEDVGPINGAPDPGEQLESGLGGFSILVEDAGGRYGASAGQQILDAFGNLLGTTYLRDNAGNYLLDIDGMPIVDVLGTGLLKTGPDGSLLIKNLAPGKYGIQAVPPPGSSWQQTSTIEGTKVIDAWVKANEPPFFAEFGPPGPHVFIGFVKPFINSAVLSGGQTISGKVVNMHLSRPPDYAFYNGVCFGHTTPWVALNDLAVGQGQAVYAAPADGDCNFSIPGVPDGNYQLVVFDNNLDLVIAFKGISITNGQCSTPGGSCNLGEVPVFQWFTRQEHFVFNDQNGNGLWDVGETPLLEQDVAIRWRDATVYQANVTDPWGAYAFDQVFPFFAWQVAEVGFVTGEATGVIVTVDNGGAIDPLDPWSFEGILNPQDQTNPATGPGAEFTQYRVETGPVLTQAFQGFLGQTSVFQWGKRHYPDGGNGGVSGIVFYAVTRAEDDIELAGAEVWEPGIPGVTVNLYDASGTTLLASTTTDSWDDSIPTGCKWGNGAGGPFEFSPDGVSFYATDCYDGLRVFNQVRPGVFDGGYAFGPEIDCGDLEAGVDCLSVTHLGADGKRYLNAGDYIVEVVPPDGYELLKPEDKNVDFGEDYVPAPDLLPPPCAGADYVVPNYLTLFPDAMIEAPFAGETVKLCDRKLVTVSVGFNAAADFFLFTEVPVAAHAYGGILDDTQNEFDPNSPQFGEKFAPPFVPIAIRDWTGRMIASTLSDQYGRFNFLAPSTYTMNLGSPSGASPNMLTACMNDPEAGPAFHKQNYSTFCYTFQYMPGVTTYLDTPIIPIAAFTGPDQFPLDCEQPDGTPRIHSVTVLGNGVGGGPYAPVDYLLDPVATAAAFTIEIESVANQLVPNPAYCNPVAGACPAGSDTTNQFVSRDYGFGASGTVTLDGDPLVCTWGDPISCTLPTGTEEGKYQLMVSRDGGGTTVSGVTLHVGTGMAPDPTDP